MNLSVHRSQLFNQTDSGIWNNSCIIWYRRLLYFCRITILTFGWITNSAFVWKEDGWFLMDLWGFILCLLNNFFTKYYAIMRPFTKKLQIKQKMFKIIIQTRLFVEILFQVTVPSATLIWLISKGQRPKRDAPTRNPNWWRAESTKLAQVNCIF